MTTLLIIHHESVVTSAKVQLNISPCTQKMVVTSGRSSAQSLILYTRNICC